MSSTNEIKNFHDEVVDFMQRGGTSVPLASASVAGVVKIGGGLSIDANTGLLSIATGVILNTLSSTVEGAMWYIP